MTLNSYDNLRGVLGLTEREMGRYYALKSVSGSGGAKGGRVVVGMPSPGEGLGKAPKAKVVGDEGSSAGDKVVEVDGFKSS